MSALIARHWPLTRLGSVVKFISGGTPKKGTESYWNGQIPWVTSGEMTSERIHNTEHALTEDGALAGSRLVPKGTSFIVVRGMSLAKEFRVSLAMRDMAFNQDVKAVIPSDEFDPSFIYYYLKSQSNPIKDSASEAAHGTKKLDMAVLEQWPIPRVPLDIQRKIAAVLCHYDDLIENNKRRITILENMAEEIYREWFVRFRFPGWQEAEFEKGLPAGWSIKRLNDILVLQYGKALKSEDRVEGTVPVYGSSGVVGFHNEALVERPGIIVGRKGNVGAIHWSDVAFYPIDTVYYVVSDLSKHFLYYLLHSVNFINNDAAVPGLNRKQAYSNEVLVPKSGLIEQFEELVKPLYDQKRSLIKMNDNLEKTKNQLLPRLISGKLSVENLDIQFPPSMQSDESDSADEAAA